MSLLYDNISALTFTEMGAITNTTTLTTNKVFTKLSCPTQQHTSHTIRGQLAADHVSAAKFNTTDNSLSLALYKCQVLSFVPWKSGSTAVAPGTRTQDTDAFGFHGTRLQAAGCSR